MTRLLATLLICLCLPLFAQEPINPPAPKLVSAIRTASGTHAELTWSWTGSLPALEHFQIMRHTPASDIVTRLVNPHKAGVARAHIAKTGTTTFVWTAKGLDRDRTYSFEVVAIVENSAGELVSSDVSNALPSPP